MKSKEKILRGHYGGSTLSFSTHVIHGSVNGVLKAMDEHARNCMIEFVYWHEGDEDWGKAKRLVDGFLPSEYFKQIQEP